jgi:GNAT superfamily N-acetyltransferase
MLLAQAVDAYEFRPAVPGDIGDMVQMYHEFFDESALPKRGLEWDGKRAWATIFNGITTGRQPFLIAIEKSSGKLAGAISYTLNHAYTAQPFADLGQFFVRPKWRRTVVAKVLLTLCLEIARADGAVMFNAGISSGIDPSPLNSMLRKMGFEDTNSMLLVRRL